MEQYSVSGTLLNLLSIQTGVFSTAGFQTKLIFFLMYKSLTMREYQQNAEAVAA